MNSGSKKITLPQSWQGTRCQVGSLVEMVEMRNEYGYYGIEVRLDPRPGKDNAVVAAFEDDSIFDVLDQRRLG